MLHALSAVIVGLDMRQLQGGDWVLGFLLWGSYLFLCMIFVVNTFLAIIMSTYDEITSEVIGAATPHQTLDPHTPLTLTLNH